METESVEVFGISFFFFMKKKGNKECDMHVQKSLQFLFNSLEKSYSHDLISLVYVSGV